MIIVLKTFKGMSVVDEAHFKKNITTMDDLPDTSFSGNLTKFLVNRYFCENFGGLLLNSHLDKNFKGHAHSLPLRKRFVNSKS